MRSDDQLSQLFISNYGKDRRLTGNQTAIASFAIGVMAPIAQLFGVNKGDPTKIFTPEEDQRLATSYTAEGYTLELEKLVIQWGDCNGNVGTLSTRAQFLINELRKVIPTIPVAGIRQFFQTKLADTQAHASRLTARDKADGCRQLATDTQVQIDKVKNENQKCCELLDYANDPVACFDKCVKPHLRKLVLGAALLAVLVGVAYGVTTGVTSGVTQKLLSSRIKNKKNSRSKKKNRA